MFCLLDADYLGPLFVRMFGFWISETRKQNLSAKVDLQALLDITQVIGFVVCSSSIITRCLCLENVVLRLYGNLSVRVRMFRSRNAGNQRRLQFRGQAASVMVASSL